MVLLHIIDSEVVPVVRLTEVFRQAAHSRIITTAHRINEGHMPELSTKNAQSDFYFIDRAEPDQIADTLVDMVKARIADVPRSLLTRPSISTTSTSRASTGWPRRVGTMDLCSESRPFCWRGRKSALQTGPLGGCLPPAMPLQLPQVL
jgi:hypothetical protein